MFFSERTGLQKLLLLKVAAGGSVVEDTATGNPLNFLTDLAKPLKSLVANFLPVQTGSGDPSPDNVRPITGWTGVNVFHAGKNLADFVNGKGSASDGTIGDSASRSATVNPIDIKSGASYVFTFESGFDGIYSVFNGDTLVRRTGANNGQTLDTSGGNKLFVCVYKSGGTATVENSSPMVRVSTAPEGYEPYISLSEYSTTFPSTIYGGYVDLVTGEVWATWDTYDLGNVSTWGKSSNGNKYYGTVPAYRYEADNVFFCNKYQFDGAGNATRGYYGDDNTIRYYFYRSLTAYEVYIRDDRYDTKEAFKEAIAGTIIAYPLAEPVLITTLTPQQINAIKGNNTIWSDASGEMTAIYYKKG